MPSYPTKEVSKAYAKRIAGNPPEVVMKKLEEAISGVEDHMTRAIGCFHEAFSNFENGFRHLEKARNFLGARQTQSTRSSPNDAEAIGKVGKKV